MFQYDNYDGVFNFFQQKKIIKDRDNNWFGIRFFRVDMMIKNRMIVCQDRFWKFSYRSLKGKFGDNEIMKVDGSNESLSNYQKTFQLGRYIAEFQRNVFL